MRKDCSKRDLHTPTAQLHPCPTLARADSLGAQKTAQTDHPLPIQMLLVTPESQAENLAVSRAKAEKSLRIP